MPISALDQAQAQDLADQQSAELRAAIAESECAADPLQSDTIVVCGEVSEQETREHMSVLPEPPEVPRNELERLREPPCWITGRWPCGRIGFAPPPVVLIDLDKFPDALTPEVEALVSAVEDAPASYP